ncbi:MAG: YfjI family protein [Rhodobacteraceae bacterium]|nr:YfjI family protein [Paracoccaceae bacterium]
MTDVKTDQEQIQTFTDALFRYASEGTFVSLRAFDDKERGKPAFEVQAVQINGSGLSPVIDNAAKMADRCANAAQSIVFCPPVVTFKNADNAKADNVAEGVALSVDCDATPIAAREKLESLLGPATVVAASGGEWTDPETGELQDKLHLHWRINEPTQTVEEHAILKQARELATKLVGGDRTNEPLVHPIRWPGSVHRKGEPRLANIVSLNEDAEIDLGDALEALQDATAAVPLSERAKAVREPHSAPIDTGQQGKTADDYARLLRNMKTDGKKHRGVRDIAASLAAQGCSQRFVEGFIKENCPVYDQNVQNSIESAFQKYAEPTPSGDPVDLWGSFEPPELPQGLLPPIIEQFARTNGDHMGADPAGLAMAALVTCGAATPDTVQIKVKRHGDWKESARLWAALIGPPSTKKSPIISAATSPLCSLDIGMMRDWQKRVAKYDALSAKDRKGKERPKQTRLRIEDVTVEAAQQVLEGSPWGVLLLQDELSGFFGAMDKYNGGKGAQADRAFWLRSYDGGQFAVNRVGRGAAIIENLSVSMLGGIQPEPLRKVAGDSVDDGLLQRLFPIMLRSATMGRDEPMPPVNDEYKTLIENLRRLTPPGFCGSGALEFDEGAQAIRRDLEARHLTLHSLETINGKLTSHIGKYDGLFARLCVVWHCIEYIENTMLCDAPGFDGDGLPPTVAEATAQRVADFLHHFLLAHAMAFYSGVLGLSDDHDRLTAIAGHILTHKLEKITNRDVQRGDRTMRGLKEFEIRPLLEQLSALGWLDRIDPPRPSSPPHWQVNPAVHAKFMDRAAREAARRKEAREKIQELAKGATA